MTKPPVFDDPAEERAYLKRRLTAAVRLFGHYGFDEGISGHLSVRDPEHHDRFWVNPFGVAFNRIRVSDLICVDTEGRVVHGHLPVNPSAFVIHSAIHTQRPEAHAAAHAHTLNSRALTALKLGLAPVDQESTAFWNDHVLCDDYEGPTVDPEQGKAVADALGDKRAILLRYHGLITVGATIDEAAFWFISFDRCAQVQLLARAAGQLVPMSDEQAASARAGFGDPNLAWYSFQVLYDHIVNLQPDFLDE
ncbi:Ribulose-5-phosphate 4-epimerase/Fuculose-1-phosphate aldolase [Lentzea fradiae]|uniref:Ribulose-5-phosphate 4-epimerase/Fuculose-1-phosphate aldolase n=2 Tax=Lentzea fradiae TaxID=200378 RepID=A0A1G8CM99_9PSEU|nr:Ribulose-5-phosphate 4-epimerase/Fuculose-1-phosphate aldolase [Lentzea fradiae]